MAGPLMLKRADRYGFCAGVRIADRTVRKLASEGRSGKILGQLVHSEHVVSDLVQLGGAVGVTAGASTPDSMIEEIECAIRLLAASSAPAVGPFGVSEAAP